MRSLTPLDRPYRIMTPADEPRLRRAAAAGTHRVRRRHGGGTALVMLLCSLLSGCDELPERPPSGHSGAAANSSANPPIQSGAGTQASAAPAASTSVAGASSAKAHGSKAPAAVVEAADAFMTAAEGYVARCWLISHWNEFTTYDRCWPKGKCDLRIATNTDKDCGFRPEQPSEIAAAAEALGKAAEGKALPGAARIFIGHVELFSAFVSQSITPVASCMRRLDKRDQHECWVPTQGTVSHYQELARAHNRWRPEHKREVMPLRNGLAVGGRPYTIDAEYRARGYPWRICPDGPCVEGRTDPDE